MSYPSLLFARKSSGKTVETHVFEDVKLSLLFSQEAIGAMAVLCQPEDIPVRQALFTYLLEEPAALQHLDTLASVIAKIHRLWDALADVKCENERRYVYVNLMAAVADFYEAAAEWPQEGGQLLTRFTDWFRNAVREEEWKGMAELAKELRIRTEHARRESFRTEGENLWMRLEYATAYVDRLQQCASDLGLKETRVTRDTSIRLDARMVNALARLHPEAFLAFKDFYERYGEVFDESILSYRYELNFYLEAAKLLLRIKNAGLPLCWPRIARQKELIFRGLRDISLLYKNETDIVPNDADFTEEEPFFFLTGANGGGKTTYLRSLAIATLFFLSGCPVCAEDASLWPVDNVYTHFPQDERFEADGRFADEQKRMGEILARHGGNSLILLNETFSTTNEELAVSCTLELAGKLIGSGSFTLYITHQHGLESAGAPFLSVIVDEQDENRRTYRIARRSEAAGSFAADILRRYGLDGVTLRQRFLARREAGEVEA